MFGAFKFIFLKIIVISLSLVILILHTYEGFNH